MKRSRQSRSAGAKNLRERMSNKVQTTQHTKLKVGDPVMVISGGSLKYPTKGQTGKVRSILRKNGNLYVTVDGVNVRKRLLRARKPGEETRFIYTETPIHISNVMYFVESINKCVRLKYKVENDKKVRGYIHPETKEFIKV